GRGWPKVSEGEATQKPTAPGEVVSAQPAFSNGFAEISNIRSIGRRARRMTSSGNSIRGARFFMQSRSFSSVFNFMYLHSLHRQLSVGIFITSNTGAQKNSFPGHSLCNRWMMPDSVTTTKRFAGFVRQ